MNEESRELVSGRGCRNTMIVIVVLAVVGFAWSSWVPHPSSLERFFAGVVGATSFGVLFLTVYAAAVNFVAIVDWFRFRKPPVVEHPILGTVRYEGMRWHARVGDLVMGFQGRRKGPDPEFVDALAYCVGNFDTLSARGKAFASERPESLGGPTWIEAIRESSTGRVATAWAFPFSPEPGDYVRVIFRGDEPVESEMH